MGGGKLVFKSLVGALFLGGSLSGVSLAQSVDVQDGSTYTSDISVVSGESFRNAGTIDNNGININTTGSFENFGNITTNTLSLYAGSYYLNGVINASNEVIFYGRNNPTAAYDSFNYDKALLSGQINTPILRIIDKNLGPTGLVINKQEIFDGITKEIYIESNGKKTGLRVGQYCEKNQSFSIEANVVLAHKAQSQDARVEIFNDSSVSFNSLSVVEGKGLIQPDDSSIANIREITVAANSRLTFQTLADINSENFATVQLSKIILKENSKIQAGPYGSYEPVKQTLTLINNSVPLFIKGDIKVDLAKGAGVDFGGYKDEENHDWLPESIKFVADSLTVNVADSSKESGSFVYLPGTKDESGNFTNLLTKVENIKLIAAANNNTGDAEADLTALANIIKTNTKKGAERVNTLRCLPGVQLEQKATDIFDGATAIIADDGDCENCTIKDVKIEQVQTQENPNINGIAEMAALGLHVWRNEIDEMHRRVGELRDSSESIDGVWARLNNGQARYGNQDVKNNYTSVQVGYDRQVSPGVWVGGALSYTDGDNDFRYGDGETDLYAFSLYNSWLFDNGIYLDLVGKIGRMKNSFDIQYDAVDSSGDYHTNAVSLSAELGWRYYATESLFVEPQAEMWYGHVFDADYHTSTGIDVDNKSVDSLVGRLGLKLGFDFPDELGSFFVKASVLHDWEGDADFTFRKGDIERSLTESLGGTWYEYGFGADFNPTDKVHLYADIEAGNGGKVDTDYRFNLGARYAF